MPPGCAAMHSSMAAFFTVIGVERVTSTTSSVPARMVGLAYHSMTQPSKMIFSKLPATSIGSFSQPFLQEILTFLKWQVTFSFLSPQSMPAVIRSPMLQFSNVMLLRERLQHHLWSPVNSRRIGVTRRRENADSYSHAAICTTSSGRCCSASFRKAGIRGREGRLSTGSQ